MAEAFHVLPLAGGLFDQPASYITRMEYVLIATSEQAKAESSAQEAKDRVKELAE